MSASRLFDTRKAWSTLQASFKTICWQMGLTVISSQEQGSVPPALLARQEDIWSQNPSQLALGLELIAQPIPVLLRPLLGSPAGSPHLCIPFLTLISPKSTTLPGVLSICSGCSFVCVATLGPGWNCKWHIFPYLCFHGLSSEQEVQGC